MILLPLSYRAARRFLPLLVVFAVLLPALRQSVWAQGAETKAAVDADRKGLGAKERNEVLTTLTAVKEYGLAGLDSLEATQRALTKQGEEKVADALEKVLKVIDDGAGWVVGYMQMVLFFDPVRKFFTPSLSPEEEAKLKAHLAKLEAYKDRSDEERNEVLEEVAKTRPKLYTSVPLIILWLMFGAIFFTFLMRFVNIRAFKHSLAVIRGKYDNPEEHGEVTHFQALCAALSATVGLGNIAGVALAVSLGGPGAVFWMVISGLFGMSSKFVECTLGQKYRRIDKDGRVSGGAMHYLERGLGERGWVKLGKALAILFAVLCVGASLGGGNMFQANQSFEAIKSALKLKDASAIRIGSVIYGVVVAVLVGLVIIGGIRRIAATAGKIVPFMCAMYVAGCAIVILKHLGDVPEAFGTIFSGAFSYEAVGGGFFGVLLIGVQRAAFSNEAGIGSAAIAHSAAKTEEPIREGIVALMEPFIDTVCVCTMTGLAVVVSGAYERPQFSGSGVSGAAITSSAFGDVASWFPYVLSLATVFFAYSTMISWSYYGERCWTYIFGDVSTMIYKVIFLVFVVIGAIINLTNVVGFSDMMLFGMAFPNLIGCIVMSRMVKRDLDSYMNRLAAGEFKTFK